jgi:hypothetical protein
MYELLLPLFMFACLWDYTYAPGTKMNSINLAMNLVGITIAFAYMLERLDRRGDWVTVIIVGMRTGLFARDVLIHWKYCK